MNMFALMGITGNVGGAVARTLLDVGRGVRAIVREPAKGAAWAAEGCDTAVADLEAAGPLATAFEGMEGVFVMLPPIFDPTPGFPEADAKIAILRQALERSRPAKVVVLSTIGADVDRPNLLNQLRRLETALADLPVPVTFLRPAWFMDNAAGDVVSARDEGVIRSHLQPIAHPLPMVAAADVGRTAAEILQEQWEGHRVIELEAPQRISPLDLAAAFSRALGREVRVEAVPRERWEAEFRAQGIRNPLPRIQMIEGFNEGWIDYPDRGASARKGRVALDEVIAALLGTEAR
jgi:NAD(P)H dehydrogenase (quinone)